MEQPLVSIIVPVYNAMRTLAACVRSICDQSYRNLEILLINDGSRDDSLNICRALAAMDDRIRVIDKPNSGVSATRNIGIENARGQYIQFVDSDDLLEREATSLMIGRAKQTGCDLVIGEFYRMVGRRIAVSTNISETGVLTRAEFAQRLMESPMNFYFGVMWNKLYRRDIIMKHGIRCSEDISWCEDFMFNLEYYRRMESVAALAVPVYYYVNRKGSLAHSYSAISPTRVFRLRRRMYGLYLQFFKELDMYDANKGQILMFFVSRARDGAVMPFSPMEADDARRAARNRIADGRASHKYRYSGFYGNQKRAARRRRPVKV